MSLKLSEEQETFRDALRGMLADTVTSEYLHPRFEGDESSDPELWQSLIDLGLWEYLGGEEEGGVMELCLIAEESGRSLLPENLVDALMYGPFLFKGIEGDVDSEILSGEKSVCHAGLANCQEAGQLRFVSGAMSSQYCLAELDDQLKLFEIEPTQVEEESSIERTLKRFKVNCLGKESQVISGVDLDYFRGLERVVRSAELYGICGRVVDMTREYVLERKQFGVTIGSFQAVQHKLVDMYVESEALKNLTRFAAWAATESPDQFQFASYAALAYGCDVCSGIVERAIQLHGGIGFTWEFDLHLFLRRAKAIEALYKFSKTEQDKFLKLARG